MTRPDPGSPFRPDLLGGRVALVTGGGTGVGRGIATALARHGADVCLASRDREHLEPAAAEVRALGRVAVVHSMDVREPDAVEGTVTRTVDELGGLDILVNNAAGNFLVRAEELSEGGWKAVVEIVLDGTFRMCRAAYPALAAAGDASIVNITTTYVRTGAPGMAHSGAAKAGVFNLTRTLAAEWGPRGIRSNCVAPGLVEGTEGARRLVESRGMTDRYLEGVPTGRLTTVDDVARAVVFLASPGARQINGAELVVDGGAGVGGTFAPLLAGGEDG